MSSLIFLQPMKEYPTSEVHSIQVTRTVGALGKQIDVLLVVGSLSTKPEALPRAVQDYYGVEFGPRVRVIAVSRSRLHGLLFPLALHEIVARAPAGAVFYTRSYLMARQLLRYRWMHRRRVFFESHKKMGYWNKEPFEGSPYAAVRQRFAQRNEPIQVIREVYRKADCVFFLHKHSLELVQRELPLRDAESLWYGLHWHPNDAPQERHGIAYIGSLTEDKLTDLLLDALDRVKTDVRVSLYGGDHSQMAALRRRAAGRPCAERLDFRGWRRPNDLPGELRGYRFGLAMQEGMKVVDYLENGLTPVVPETPAYRDVFDERHVIYYPPDDPQQLAEVLDTCASHALEASPAALQEFCAAHSIERRAQTILTRLEQKHVG